MAPETATKPEPEMTQEMAWQEVRRSGVGSSDAAAICGISPYSTPLQVWLEKSGRITDDRETEPMRFGKRLEEVVLGEFARRQEVEVFGRDRYGIPALFKPDDAVSYSFEPGGEHLLDTLRHPDYEYIMAHVDGFVVPAGADASFTEIVEAKTTSAYRDDWGDSPDDVPVEYIVQVSHQMLVLDGLGHRITRAWIPVLRGGNEFRIYYVDRQDDLVANLLKLEVDFWTKHVETDEPPAAHPNDGKALEVLHPHDDGEMVEVDDTFDKLSRAFFGVKVQLADLEDQKKALEAELKERIADNAGVEGPEYKVTWKRTKDGTAVDWEAAFKEYASRVALRLTEGSDEAVEIKDLAVEVVGNFTSTRPGYRVLRTPRTETMRKLVGGEA